MMCVLHGTAVDGETKRRLTISVDCSQMRRQQDKLEELGYVLDKSVMVVESGSKEK